MKLRIEPEQLEELNLEQRTALMTYWVPEMGDWIYDINLKSKAIISGFDTANKLIYITWFNGGDSQIKNSAEYPPLLSISQMISILCKDTAMNKKISDFLENSPSDLCDYLWHEINQILPPD